LSKGREVEKVRGRERERKKREGERVKDWEKNERE
jgi:hypothetical protein